MIFLPGQRSSARMQISVSSQPRGWLPSRPMSGLNRPTSSNTDDRNDMLQPIMLRMLPSALPDWLDAASRTDDIGVLIACDQFFEPPTLSGCVVIDERQDFPLRQRDAGVARVRQPSLAAVRGDAQGIAGQPLQLLL